MIWNQKAECMENEELRKIQLKLLKLTVNKAYDNIEFYKKRFDKINLHPDDIQELEDIKKIPFTTKSDLRETYPFGMFAVPDEEIIEIHTSSGTTGKPTVSGYTSNDLDIWGESVARCLSMAGARKNYKIQNCYGYGLFTGGLGIHYGTQKVGATIIPISAGNTKRQIEILKDFKTDILTCTPSYALYIAEVLKETGLGPEDINLKAGVFGAEMWTEEMRNTIEEKLGINALNIYGLTEVMGPGVAHECEEKVGLHIFEDHFYPEIIDPTSGENVDDGVKGELVLTTLTREGTPVLRFRTKDITALNHEKCDCNRTLVRMDRITGRTDDMLKIRGVIVFPSQIEKALLQIENLHPQYQIIVTRPDYLDELEVQVETSSEMFSDEIKRMEELKKKIENNIHSEIGLRVNVTLIEPNSLPRSEGKAKRVIDKRNFT